MLGHRVVYLVIDHGGGSVLVGLVEMRMLLGEGVGSLVRGVDLLLCVDLSLGLELISRDRHSTNASHCLKALMRLLVMVGPPAHHDMVLALIHIVRVQGG